MARLPRKSGDKWLQRLPGRGGDGAGADSARRLSTTSSEEAKWMALTPEERLEGGGVKSQLSGTSLAVQWLRICTFTVGVVGSVPGWGIRIANAMLCGQINKQTNKRFFEIIKHTSLKKNQVRAGKLQKVFKGRLQFQDGISGQ